MKVRTLVISIIILIYVIGIPTCSKKTTKSNDEVPINIYRVHFLIAGYLGFTTIGSVVRLKSQQGNNVIQKTSTPYQTDGVSSQAIFDDVPEGRYNLTITQSNYRTFADNINITRDYTRRIDLIRN